MERTPETEETPEEPQPAETPEAENPEEPEPVGDPMLNRITATLAVFCLALAAALTVTGPATAAPGCIDDRMCLHDTSTVGPFFEVEDVDTVRNQCIGGITPITSYVTNRTIYRWIVSTSNDCSANRGVIYPESQGAMGPTWNNRIRGMYRTSSTSLVADGLPSALG